MKLTRQTTSDLDRHEKERSITGHVRSSNLMRGNIHYFIIENATPAELIAIDDLLEEAGWTNDSCPNYEESYPEDKAGYSCGYWIDVEEVEAFKADYKRLKGHVAARVRANMGKEQGDALDSMTEEEVYLVKLVASRVYRDLRTKGESLKGLRSIGTTKSIIMNPYYNSYTKISQKGWELIHQTLMTGTIDEVASWLICLDLNCQASIDRRPAITKLMEKTGVTRDVAHRAIRAANNNFDGALKALNDALEATERHPEALAVNDAFDNSFSRYAANWGAMDWMSREIELEKAHVAALELDKVFTKAKARYDHFWGAYSYFQRKDKVEKAFDEARIMNRLIGNIDLLPEQAPLYGLRTADIDFIMDVSSRLYPDLYSQDVEEVRREQRRIAEVVRAEFWLGNPVTQREDIAIAHDMALVEDAAFNAACRAETMKAVRRYVVNAVQGDSAAQEPDDILPLGEGGELEIEAVGYIAHQQKYPLEFVILDSHVFVGAVRTNHQYDTNYYLGVDQAKRKGRPVYLRVPGLSPDVIRSNPQAFQETALTLRTLLPDVDHTPVGGVAKLRAEILGE